MMKYMCDECAYACDPNQGDEKTGVPPGTPFENPPGGWVCPVCGATKDRFAPTRYDGGVERRSGIPA